MSGQLDSNQLAVGLLLSALTIFVSNYSKVVRKPKIFTGNVLENKIVENCPSLNSIYWPSPWCWNAHLQFVPFVIRGLVDRYLYPPFSWISEEIQLVDGEFVILDWIARAPHVTDGLVASKKDTTPIVMIHHGAMCDSRDLPGQGYIQQALDRGWIVCALNRRGHAKNLTMGKWNFFGDVNDVHQVVKSIKQRRPKAILFTIGISSGSGLVARHFGEGDLNEFDAGVGICPGYDISKCLSRFSSPYKVCTILCCK